MENENIHRQCTFVVKILSRRNSTWQGEVTWVERQQTKHFRSALELLKLVDSCENEVREAGRDVS